MRVRLVSQRKRWGYEGKHRGITHKYADALLVIQLGKVEDKSPHVCSAAGANLNTVCMLRRVREI